MRVHDVQSTPNTRTFCSHTPYVAISGAHTHEPARQVRMCPCAPSERSHQQLQDGMRMSPHDPRAPELQKSSSESCQASHPLA